MPVAAARGRQSVWSCRATRGGHRRGVENAIFTFPAAYSYRGQCEVQTRCAHPSPENMSSSDDGEPQVPMMTVVHALGDARSGADFEAGRGGRPRGEHIKGRA